MFLLVENSAGEVSIPVFVFMDTTIGGRHSLECSNSTLGGFN